MQPDPNAAAVAEHVRKVLAEVGVSAAEVARRLATQEMPYATVQAYIARRMSGRVAFSTTDLVNIAQAIGVAPTQLLPDATTLTTSDR